VIGREALKWRVRGAARRAGQDMGLRAVEARVGFAGLRGAIVAVVWMLGKGGVGWEAATGC